jgi:hypothetical protein
MLCTIGKIVTRRVTLERVRTYADLALGPTHASLVALAERHVAARYR